MASGVTIQGLDELRDALKELGEKEALKAMREANVAGGERILARARALVPRRTGLLATSLGAKTTSSKKGVVNTIVGPRKGFAKSLDNGKGGRSYIDPRKYAHLVEFGTVRTKAKPFLGPAIEAEMASVSGGQYVSDLDLAIKRAVARLARKAERAAKKAAK